MHVKKLLTDIYGTSRNGNRKIMQLTSITSGPPTEKDRATRSAISDEHLSTQYIQKQPLEVFY